MKKHNENEGFYEEVALMPERYVRIGHTCFRRIVTAHAAQRAMVRLQLTAEMLGMMALASIIRINAANPLLLCSCAEYVAIRDFGTRLFIVMQIDRQEQTVRIVTAGDVRRMYPRENDFTIRVDIAGGVTAKTWEIYR